MSDQLGREVAVVADGEYEAGIHRFTWDVGALPTGVYHCRLRTASGSTAARIVLLH